MNDGCAICGMPRILTKCVACGGRVCRSCYESTHNLCATCAEKKGIAVRTGPHMWTAH